MNDKDKELLAEYHHTVSEQLNARLSESPRFFGLLIVVATGYGYVLSKPDLANHKELFVLTSFLSYAAVLWAVWYLAALGYAFRFLQNIQHSIEHELGWSEFTPLPESGRRTGQPPSPASIFWDTFWLLPGIYHAHVAGLGAFVVIISAASGFYAYMLWTLCWQRCLATVICALATVVGLISLFWINRHYLSRFTARRNPKGDV